MTNPNPVPINADYQRDWPAYFDAVHDKPPRDTLLKALERFAPENTADSAPTRSVAVDLGCGEGRDTRELLRCGWRVIAVDSSEVGLSRLCASVQPPSINDLVPLQIGLADVPGVLAHLTGVRFVNASFALPFCEPESFPSLWAWIVGVLAPGGRFAGQFFGDRDEWAPIRPGSHHTRSAVEAMLAPFQIEHFEEVDKIGGDALGGTKHHHLFHIVARKR